ncbi:thioredoxin domain-containing protein [Mucilaginibacter panaciglaebae]|uniref:Thioredoxin domain-containing protein n=1 Tax=Mucilaginibacter panaciglaebae TaxID=502331 RepID=A0ABP7WF99_9SPHI
MNRLANSTSPYLLQHANNPVDWHPWGPEALQKARDENKLIIVSIGYSACHWCHVMEHESFEDEQVAAVMNEYFVCIKVDREERPDVDQIYMSAVQLISGRGGWPLNCICLPDQRPIYAGTYFRKNDWTSLLFNLADYYKQKPEEALEYATRLTDGIRKYESIPFVTSQPGYKKEDVAAIVGNWKKYFDRTEGGMGTAPKFPMPNNWHFLIRYAHLMQDEEIGGLAKLTLQKMAEGGIYDHLGGGFARYAVDGLWHVPHFEKMLYDNGQLASLYAEAYTWQPSALYKQIVDEIIGFAARELLSPEGGFYSALDADSEGVEGKFYTFDKEEIQKVLGIEAELFCIYYHITDEGNWEEEQTNILFKRGHDNDLAEAIGISVDEMLESVTASRKKLFEARTRRTPPGLDNKILASWNGLMLKGLCDAYRAFNEQKYLDLALKNAGFIVDNLLNRGRIIRVYKDPANLEQGGKEAFLDDYANVIDAFIALYEVTFDEQWLGHAVQLADNAIDHYFDDVSGMFYFTADDDELLIARKSEIMDGVIPSSNSVMARNLHKLGLLFDNQHYTEIAGQQLRNIMPHMAKYGSAYSNWCMLLLDEVFGTAEVAIVGDNSEVLRIEMEKNYIPNKIILGGTKGSLPLLRDKFTGKTQIFVCKDKTCGLPAATIADALKQIEA